MRIAITHFFGELLRYPSDETVRYFCKNDMKFYYNIEISKDIPKKKRVKYVIPLIRINIIELMEEYLNSVNITKEEVIKTAMESEPNNSTWQEDEESIFDVAFRIFIDGRYLLKDGKEIDMVHDWFNYRRKVCFPIAKKFCEEYDIKWYDSHYIHFFHKWHTSWELEPNKKDIFVIEKNEKTGD